MRLKYCLNIVSIVFLALVLSSSKPSENCRCKSVLLYGRVKEVKHNPDFKVQVVSSSQSSSADIKVQKVERFPDSCGKWQFVDSNPDFTVQFVDFNPDFKIEFVKSSPGIRSRPTLYSK